MNFVLRSFFVVFYKITAIWLGVWLCSNLVLYNILKTQHHKLRKTRGNTEKINKIFIIIEKYIDFC